MLSELKTYWTVSDVAQFWSVPRYTVLGLVATRKLHLYRREGKLVFHVSDLNAYLHANSYEAGDRRPVKFSKFTRLGMWLDERGW